MNTGDDSKKSEPVRTRLQRTADAFQLVARALQAAYYALRMFWTFHQ